MYSVASQGYKTDCIARLFSDVWTKKTTDIVWDLRDMNLFRKLKALFNVNLCFHNEGIIFTFRINFPRDKSNLKCMEQKKVIQTKLVFADVFNIKTRTTFNTDGTLEVVPVDWREGDVKLVTPTGKKPPKIYGKMQYNLDGHAMFVPSRRSELPRYNVLHSDSFLQIKETDKDLIFKIQASKGFFADKKTVKPVIESFDWAKKYINNDIQSRQNHKKNGSKSNLLQGR